MITENQNAIFNPLDYLAAFQKPRHLTEVSSWHSHIPFAFALVEMLKPGLLVELGTHKGDSYCSFCQAVDTLQLSTSCYAVDTWEGDEHSGKYDDSIYQNLKAYHDPIYSSFSTLMRCTFDQALPHFQDESIDLLHIDGLHTYEAVRHDFDSWLPKMSRSGVILLHDINVYEKDFGVWQLWQEIQLRYPAFEFKHGHGLGVAAVGKEIPPALQNLFASRENMKAITSYFSRLGETVAAERGLAEGQAARRQLADAEKYVAGVDRERLELKALEAELEQTVESRTREVETLTRHREELEQHLAKVEQERLELKAAVNEAGVYRQKLEALVDEAVIYKQQSNLNQHKLEAALAEARRKQKEAEERLAAQIEPARAATQAPVYSQAELDAYLSKSEQEKLELSRSLQRYEADLRALQGTRTVKIAQTLGSILETPKRFKR